jgi:hypothetical protein
LAFISRKFLVVQSEEAEKKFKKPNSIGIGPIPVPYLLAEEF